MSDGLRLSMKDFNDKELAEQLGGAIKGVLSEQGKGKWIGTSNAWIGAKAAEAIDDTIGGVDLLDLFGAAWVGANALQALADPKKYPPEKTNYVKLGKHTIASDFKPKLMVSMGPWTSPPIEFVLGLSTAIEAMELQIKAGHILAVCGGSCDVGVTIKLGDRALMPRKSLKTVRLDVEHRFQAPGLRIANPRPVLAN